MRILLFFLIHLLFLIVEIPSVPAAEVLLGKVVFLDRQAGAMQLALDSNRSDNDGEADVETSAKVITVKFSSEQSSSLPSDALRTGDIVRVWGDFQMHNGDSLFQASHIMPNSLRGRRTDPTGVRARLGKWRKAGGRSSVGGRGKGGGK